MRLTNYLVRGGNILDIPAGRIVMGMQDTNTSAVTFSWNWKTVLQVSAIGILEAAMWTLMESFPRWFVVMTVVSAMFFILSMNTSVKWRGFRFVPWALGLLYLGMLGYAALAPKPVSIRYEPSIQISGWGAKPESSAAYVIFSSHPEFFSKYERDYYLLAVFRAPNPRVDYSMDPIVDISNPFAIPDPSVPLEIDIPISIASAQRLTRQTETVTIYMLLVPKSLMNTNVKTIGDVQRGGGRVLQSAGFGMKVSIGPRPH